MRFELKPKSNYASKMSNHVLDYYNQLFVRSYIMDKIGKFGDFESFDDSLKFYKELGLLTDKDIEEIKNPPQDRQGYIVEWGNGEYVDYEFKDNDEALDFWKKHLHDYMPLLKMWNYYTKEELEKPKE